MPLQASDSLHKLRLEIQLQYEIAALVCSVHGQVSSQVKTSIL